MDKTFDPGKYQMSICPICDGYGLIRSSDDVKVCENVEDLGLLRKTGKVFIKKTNQS